LEIFLAIIVDKEKKKRDIALSCKELILKNGINNLTVSQVAKSAKIGKGTIYEYFKNKDEIVFELVNILMQQYNEAKEKKLLDVASTKEKIKVLMDFFYDDAYFDIRVLYKDFTAITLMNNNENMVTFQTERFKFYTDWIDDIIQEGIDKQELIPHAKELVMGLFAYSQGIFIMSVTSNAIESLKGEMNTHIDTLFTLMEVKS
jgi:AcrR family transcriptional regulator